MPEETTGSLALVCWLSPLWLLRMLLPAPSLLVQMTFGMAVCVHFSGGCTGQHTVSPVRSLSCSVAEWRLAAVDVVGVAVGGFTLEKSVEIMR